MGTAQSSVRLAGGIVTNEVLLDSGKLVDLNGEADALVIDADGDTTISSPTDDQIDIEISNADDFRFTANTFTALSGSTIATDTIAETTGAAGVTIDGCLIKDGVVQALRPVAAASANGAISLASPVSRTIFVTKSGVCAMTIADPTATTHDGLELTFIATTANAHTLDNSAGSGFFDAGGSSKDVATFGGAIGDGLTIVAYQGKWYIKPGNVKNITLG